MLFVNILYIFIKYFQTIQKNVLSNMFAVGHSSSDMACNDSRKWPGIFVTQSACPDCCGGFNSQSLSEYHLLHAATRKGLRGQSGFRCESLDISFISQITHKHKGEEEPASEENRVRDRRGERTDSKYGEMTLS